VRPFISESPLTSPEQLAEAAALPTDAVVGDRINDEQHKDFIEELAPGESKPYSISIPRRLLHVSTPGVYWFGIHALGENAEGRDDTADGRARTFLPLVPDARTGEEPTAIVIPLRHALVLRQRRLARGPGRVDEDALPRWPAPVPGRLRCRLGVEGRDLGDRPGPHRRRTPDR
jgi:hypothetical protein